MSISSLSQATSVYLAVQAHASPTTATPNGNNASSPGTADTATGAPVAASSHVSLSAQGQAASRTDASATDAASDTPEELAEIIKRIRELKQQLDELMRQLQETMANQRLSVEERDARVAALQAQIGAISSALNDAMNLLNEKMAELDMDNEQKAAVAQSLMA